MRTIGIKLADGSFYPVLKEGSTEEVVLNLTTANNNQTKVMVDLYRSKTESMDDAEYVDSLQIENLNEHPNGEPDIAFSVHLDDNNELHAKMVDSETGAQSNSTITLVSRTLEERLVPSDDTITQADIATEAPTEEAPAEAADPSDDFNLGDPTAFADDATVDETPAEETFDIPTDETPAEETFDIPTDETPADQAFDAAAFDIPADIETTPAEEPVFEETAVATEEVETPAEETFEMPLDEPTAEAPAEESFDIPLDEPVADEAPTEESFDIPTDDTITEQAFDLPTDEPVADEAPTEESFDIPTDDTITEQAFDLPTDEPAVDEAAETSAPDPSAENVASQFVEDDLTSFGGEAAHEDQSDLENFFGNIEENDAPADDATEAPTEESFDIPEETSPDFGDMPDMDAMPDFGDISADLDDPTAGLGDFDVPAEEEPAGSSEHDDFFGIGDDDAVPSAGGISFTGLYDKNTDYADADDGETQKTKAPVIICVICAIICLIAVALILFVLPTKYNLIANGAIKTKPKTEKVAEAPAVPVAETPAPAVEVEAIPAAKENEVIIIEKAEEVVPLPPPVAEKPSDIQYRIKWGDTLWDISDTYYKNPWRYKYLARYNNIQNPDYIISGTMITIPAE